MTRWTLSLSWGPSGGFYLHRHRVCLGRLALTFVPDVEIDDLMEAYVERAEGSGTARA
jgi:hypothetical protein